MADDEQPAPKPEDPIPKLPNQTQDVFGRPRWPVWWRRENIKNRQGLVWGEKPPTDNGIKQ